MRGKLSAPAIEGAARHFNEAAEAYERSRPEYPRSAVGFLRTALSLGPGVRVVDLAAGTGKLSRALAETGVDLVGVEPLPRMREVYRRAVPEVRVLEGVAEAIPLPDSFANVVATGQAFHWFATREALDEIARVLVPKGALVLLWNKRDQSVPWVREFSDLLEPYRGDAPTYRNDRWRAAFQGAPFGPLRHRTFRFVQYQSRAEIADRALSVSFIAGLPAETQAEVARSVERLLDRHPETAGHERIAFPYETTVYWCRKLERTKRFTRRRRRTPGTTDSGGSAPRSASLDRRTAP